MYLVAIETVVQVGILLVLGTQVAIPLIRGTAVFPFFRKRGKVEEEIIMVKEELAVKERENVLASLRKRSQRDERKNE